MRRTWRRTGRTGGSSRGAATAEGKERSRAAHLRHGFYSSGREEALAALGEDPAALAALIASTHAEFRPASDFQARLSERLARLWWRMERAERLQESLAVELMHANQQRRNAAAMELRRQGVPAIDILSLLAGDADDPRFYTPRDYFRQFCQAFGDELEGDRKQILLLMHRLRKPKTRRAAPPPHPGPEGEPSDDSYLADLAAADEDDFPLPWPKTPVAEGAERDGLREELAGLAKMELEFTRQYWEPQFEERQRPLTRIELEQAQAAPHPHAELLRREEASCFRQFMRLSALLLKLQKHEEKLSENEGSSGYIDENTQAGQTSRATESAESEARSPKSGVQDRDAGVGKAGARVPSPEFGFQDAEAGGQSPLPAAGIATFDAESAISEARNGEFEAASAGSETRTATSRVESEHSPKVEHAAA